MVVGPPYPKAVEDVDEPALMCCLLNVLLFSGTDIDSLALFNTQPLGYLSLSLSHR